MKTGNKIRIIKVCAPFFGNELLGKVSTITIKEDNIIYLNDIGINIPIGCIEIVDEHSIDENIDYCVYTIIEQDDKDAKEEVDIFTKKLIDKFENN